MHDFKGKYNNNDYNNSIFCSIYKKQLPLKYETPHLCSLDMIVYIQLLFDNRWIDTELYESWMYINGGLYRLNNDPRVMDMWKLKTLELKQSMNSNTDIYLESFDKLNEKSNIPPHSKKYLSIVVCSRHINKKVLHVKYHKVSNLSKLSRNDFKCLNYLFPYSSPADKAKTNLDVASLVYYMCLNKFDHLLNDVFEILPIGSFNITVTAFLIQSIGNPIFNKMHDIIVKDRACCMMSELLYNYFKAFSVALRRTISWPDGTPASLEDVCCGGYWEMCIGRSTNVSDWDEERFTRTQQTVPLRVLDEKEVCSEETNLEFVRQLGLVLDEVMNELIIEQPRWSSWQEFGEKRQSWVSTGTAGSSYIVIDGEKVKLSKPAFFETLSKSEFNALLDTTPAIYSSASDKMEQSKSRAIYGTAPTDYAIMTYVLQPLETRFYNISGIENGLRGLDQIAGVWRRVNEVNECEVVECMMIDYVNYNYQHSLEAQSEVFKALLRRLRGMDLEPDAFKAIKWCADALLNQYCKFPGDKHYSRIVQGMFSGIRGTSFIDTILNVSYFRLTQRLVASIFNVRAVELYNIHSGDDVWISNKNRLWNICMYNSMQYMGFKFNDAKQLFSKNVGEFLRVWYTPEGARGYLARAIGSFIQRPIQGSDLLLPDAHAASLCDQLNLLVRRGLKIEAGQVLWVATIPHALTFKVEPLAAVTIPTYIAKKKHRDNGLDIGPPGYMSLRSLSTPKMPSIDYSANRVAAHLPRHSSEGWIRYMSSRITAAFNAPKVLDALHVSNSIGSLPVSDKLIAARRYSISLAKWKTSLSKHAVSCSQQNFSDWLSNAADHHDVIDNKYQRITSTSLDVKRLSSERTTSATIYSAVAQSPYKDLDTCKQATGLGIIECAILCCSMSTNQDLGQLASLMISQLRINLGDIITSHVLREDFSYGNFSTTILNPTILSWCISQATESAIHEASALSISDLNKFLDLLCDTIDSYVSYCCSKMEWVALSKY